MPRLTAKGISEHSTALFARRTAFKYMHFHQNDAKFSNPHKPAKSRVSTRHNGRVFSRVIYQDY